MRLEHPALWEDRVTMALMDVTVHQEKEEILDF